MNERRPGLPIPFELWPQPNDASGSPRKVGVEIEFAGLGVEATADLIIEQLGGLAQPVGPHQIEVLDTELGTIRVELDSRFLKEERHWELLEAIGLDPELGARVDRWIGSAAGTIVPCEVVTAPLAFEQLPLLDALRERLREQGAKGTGAEPWYAFGVHFNPSLPSEDSESLHAHLQAFCLLEDWIRDVGQVALSRRLTTFVDPFPEEYRSVILAPGRAPPLPELIDRYLDHNPTRNRGLDMLPAFAHLDEARVKRRIDDPRVKARPTFHYRLANCRVDEPEWTIAEEWSRWVAVERLAADRGRREDLVRRGVRAEG